MALLDHNLGFREMVDLVLHRSGHAVSDEIRLVTERLRKQLVYRKLYQASHGVRRARALKRSGLFYLYSKKKHIPTSYKKNSTTFTK